MTNAKSLAAPPRGLFGLLLCATLIAALDCVRDPSPLQIDFRALADALRPHHAAQHASTPLSQAAPPFFLHASSPAERDRAVRCLTDAIYYEAGDEPEAGQRAVAQVVVNRIRDPHFPKSVCGVVYEGWRRHTGCQFSFVCDGSIRRRHADQRAWERLRPLAEQALGGFVAPEVGAATHYYANYVHPGWIGSVKEVAQVGRQIFCTWRGQRGQPSALTGAYSGGEFEVTDAALSGAPAPTTHAVLKQLKHRRLPRLKIAMAHAAHDAYAAARFPRRVAALIGLPGRDRGLDSDEADT